MALQTTMALLNHETYLGMILEFISSMELIHTVVLLSRFHHDFLSSKRHCSALIKRVLRREFGVAVSALGGPSKPSALSSSSPLSLVRIMHNFWDDAAMGNGSNFMERIMEHRDNWTFHGLCHFISRLSAKSTISVDLLSFDRSSGRVSVLRDHNEHILFLLFDAVLQSLYSNERALESAAAESEDEDAENEDDAVWRSEEDSAENEPWSLLSASTMTSSLYRNVKPTEDRLRRWAPKMERFLELLHWMAIEHEYEFDADDLWTFYHFYPFCNDRVRRKMLSLLIDPQTASPSIHTLFYPLESVVERTRSTLGAQAMDGDFSRIWPKWSRVYTHSLIPDMVKYAVQSARLCDDQQFEEHSNRSTTMIDHLVEITDLIGPTKMLQLFLDMLCDDNVDEGDWTYYEAILFCILELSESEAFSSSDNAKLLYIPQVIRH